MPVTRPSQRRRTGAAQSLGNDVPGLCVLIASLTSFTDLVRSRASRVDTRDERGKQATAEYRFHVSRRTVANIAMATLRAPCE